MTNQIDNWETIVDCYDICESERLYNDKTNVMKYFDKFFRKGDFEISISKRQLKYGTYDINDFYFYNKHRKRNEYIQEYIEIWSPFSQYNEYDDNLLELLFTDEIIDIDNKTKIDIINKKIITEYMSYNFYDIKTVGHILTELPEELVNKFDNAMENDCSIVNILLDDYTSIKNVTLLNDNGNQIEYIVSTDDNVFYINYQVS